MSQHPYKIFSAEFDAYLQQAISQLPASPKNVYEPLSYFLALGGKRIRPLLVLIAADFFNSNTQEVLPAAAAIELFHNFSLIHDDIMDNAPLRRNQATIHEKWNRDTAILSGDVLFVKAYQQLALLPANSAPAIYELFSKTAIEVCEGQQLDMDFETQAVVSIDEYIKMIRLKTAVVLAGSLKMGALCAQASKADSEYIYQVGEKLGIAFQLTDDYLDVFGKPEQVGKQTGGDIIARKKTWLWLKALERANPQQKQQLQELFLNTNIKNADKVHAVTKIYSDLNLPYFLNQEIENYYQEALSLLQKTSTQKDKAATFAAFAKSLMVRDN
ncbi:MAG: polyprenyl synthetase family protein [Bacteroidetes bacterium]|nr:polyprenyl synthetase family protein [Bacteroidota bacterium]